MHSRLHLTVLASAMVLTATATSNCTAVDNPKPKPHHHCGDYLTPLTSGDVFSQDYNLGDSPYACATQCLQLPACKAFSFSSFTGICIGYSQGGKKVGFAHYNEGNQWWHRDCFLLPDSCPYTPPEFKVQVFIAEDSIYNTQYMSLNVGGDFYDNGRADFNSADGATFYYDTDGSLVETTTGRKSMQIQDGEHLSIIFPDPEDVATSGLTYVPVYCSGTSDPGSNFECSSSLGNLLYGCSEEGTTKGFALLSDADVSGGDFANCAFLDYIDINPTG